jgi:hypothetical protein
MPLAGFAARRERGTRAGLPRPAPAALGAAPARHPHLLGTVHHTTLGMYSTGEPAPARLEPLARFRRAGRIGRVIRDRNCERAPYTFLDRWDPQSINV